MQCIDLHSHVIPPRVVETIHAQPEIYKTRIEGEGRKRKFARGTQGFELSPELYDVDAKIESMNRKGIDISVISPVPGVFFYGLDAENAMQISRLTNEGVARMVAAHPKRLRGMATLPMQHPDAALAELERVVKEYDFKAVELGTAIGEEELADAKFRAVLRRIEELEVVIFAHPNTMGSAGRLGCYHLVNLIGNPLDTTIMVAKLMFSGALDELKEIKILLAHGGGFLPYQIGRFEHGHTVRLDTSAVTKSKPFDMFKRFYFDALTHSPQAVRYLIDTVGSARVVIGTDSPFDMGEEHPLERLAAVPGLSESEREDICYRSALRLFGGSI